MTERRGAKRKLDAAKCEDGRRAKRPVNGEQVFFARLAGQSLAHLCAGEDIRAMPETEIPPAMRGDHYCPYARLRYVIYIFTRMWYNESRKNQKIFLLL